MSCDLPNRWNHIRKILERSGPFSPHEFEPCPELIEFIQDQLRVLVVGAGGLGCELLKNLALLGIRNLDVIDMDTIDLSNLNRQFLFRMKDIGRSKAEVAADFINNRISGAKVTPHFCKIQDKDEEFYSEFHIVVCGLDSIVARRWINAMLVSLLVYDDDGNLDETSVKMLVDGGTEGFKGNARVIVPGKSACVECTLDLYPPQVNFPLCTIATTPRLPEHCIEYVKVLLWPKEWPFGDGVPIDGDDPNHIQWIYEKSLERAQQFRIENVTYRLTQGVVKRIIPAVASTNAVIAASCATEVLKCATMCYPAMKNYMVFNDAEGIYTYTYEQERREDCMICTNVPQVVNFKEDTKLSELIEFLGNSDKYQMKSPGITTTLDSGKNKTIFMQSAVFEEISKANLKKSFKELELVDGQQLLITDVTCPNSRIFKLKLSPA